MGCFIIHLERATARLAQVRRLRQELPIAPSIMKAVDGASMTGPQQAHYKRHLLRPSYPFPLRPAEVATFLSHRACWQAIVNQGLDAALILERILPKPGQMIQVQPDIDLVHLFDADSGQRLHYS